LNIDNVGNSIYNIILLILEEENILNKNRIIFINIIFIIIFNSCLNKNEYTPQKFVEEIIPNSFSMKLFIEKYGNPDNIIEDIYNYDPSGKVVDIFYGENVFNFYINNKNMADFSQGWKIRNNFTKYSKLFVEDNINRNQIINAFRENFREYNIYGNNHIGYKLEDSELIFVFKENKLIEIIWTLDR
jgi:hypothetical protein